MDAVAKLLLLVGLVVLSLSTRAQDIEPLTDEEKETLVFALEHANAAIAALEARVEECDKASRGKVLDPALFKSFSLTDQEWRYVLSTLYHRADARCINKDGVHYRALIALMQFKDTEKSYTGKNATKTRYVPESICCNTGMFWARNEMRYSKLNPKIRRRLEAIPGINEPFDVLRTIDALERSMKKTEAHTGL